MSMKALRAQACRLNGIQPANSLPPKYKTTGDMRAAAEAGDDHLAQGCACEALINTPILTRLIEVIGCPLFFCPLQTSPVTSTL